MKLFTWFSCDAKKKNRKRSDDELFESVLQLLSVLNAKIEALDLKLDKKKANDGFVHLDAHF